MLLGLLLASGYVFLKPYVVGHVPGGSEFGLVLILILCTLSALVIPMNVFRVRMLKTQKRRMGGGMFGSILGVVSGACSCGPLGFTIISTLGSAGATASAFVTTHEIPIRIGAIIILLLTYYTTIRSLKVECRVGM